MSLMMCTRTMVVSVRPSWTRASPARAFSSPAAPAASAPPVRGRSPPRARGSSRTITAARSAPVPSRRRSTAPRCRPTSPTRWRPGGCSTRHGARSAASTSARRSPASGRRTTLVWALGLDRWEQTLRANLTATFLTARAFLREVERNGAGSLVLVGSTAGLVGEAGHADYAAAKSAITGGLLLSLKNEIVRVAPGGRVSAVAPGWTESPMTRGHVDPSACAAFRGRWRSARSRSRGRRRRSRRPRLRHALRPRHRPGDGRRWHGGPRRARRPGPAASLRRSPTSAAG